MAGHRTETRAAGRARLAAAREKEAGEALAELGLAAASRTFLRLRDADMPPAGSHVREEALQAIVAVLNAHRPDLARGTVAAAGYGEYFIHRTGHGLGLDVHEPPYLTATSDTVLEEGMVFSIEPGIYLPGRFGVRLEEILILRADGPEILSELPRSIGAA